MKKQPRITDLRKNKPVKETPIEGEDETIILCACGELVTIDNTTRKSAECSNCGLRHIKSLI